ncbi:tetratricopeptide repeat protein [Desulfoprunum benzoelyticum]|uniref:Tetratricopeptide (TPR) repeat protein n=1 Tax=Desulfoprunum benzoelyticum TaxID=1506996 RepID=A0A840UTI2_9BACT|nr:tetratricopeptide repeat protein [Desulfoprunum benzoelyticum]MBB5348985.1 tetratricopeptide (TPR) repeat protein [Desulfoprunum benzoelyticum]MBM9528853.1 tetratricopeptide repeat protein [Desulfoprunum benzoelyticum]
MTTTLQNIGSIAPMAGAKDTDPADPVRTDYEEGRRFLQNREYSQAAVSLHNALVGFEKRGEETGIANASNQLGHVCLARQEFTQALQHYQRALGICDKLQDQMSLVAVQKKLIEVFRGLNDHSKAIEICLELLDSYHRNNDPRGTVEILEEMALIYLDSGNKGKAADAYRTVASIHRNFRHHSIAESYVKKAEDIDQAA